MNDAKRIRVLIVDDDRDDADLMNARLQRAGFAVRWAETEREFRNELKLSVDVIVADYTMPAFGALQVLEIVAASGRDTPVIVVSGAVGEDKVGEVMTAGAADYLLKDRLGRLESAIEQALKRRDLRRARERAEQEVAEREARLSAVIAGQPDGVMVVERDGAVRSMNPAALRLFEVDDERSLAGASLTTFLHPSDRFSYWRLHRAALEGESGKVKFRLLGRRGTERWMEAHAAPFDTAGADRAVLSIIRDITQSRLAELRMRESESVLNQIADSLPVAFWLVELQPYRVLFATKRAAELLGTTREALYADPALLRREEPRRIGEREFDATLSDGTVIRIHERTHPVRDEAGDVYRISGVLELGEAESHERAADRRR